MTQSIGSVGTARVSRLNCYWVVFLVFGTLSRTAPAADLDVLITEVHYNVFQEAGEEILEFVEIQNRGPTYVNIGGWQFTEGIHFTFPSDEMLAPGEYAVVSAYPPGARVIYGLERVFGPFEGRLDNGGEVLALANRAGWVINRIHFDDDDPWPARPDGRGPSLEFTGSDNGNDQGRRWKPSLYLNGTPAAPNSRLVAPGELEPAPSPYIGGVINEVKHPEGGDPGFIELYNSLSRPLDVSGHFLLSSDLEFRFEIPAGTVIAPGTFAWFSGNVMGLPIPVAERRYLLLGDDGRTILDDLEVSPVEGRGFGRFPDGDDDSHVLDAPTPGVANTYTEERSVVINEIHYHPPFVAPDGDCPGSCSDRLQWIELYNPGAQEVDLGGWRLSSAVRFEFGNVAIPAGAYLIIAANVAAFSGANPAVPSVVGDWSGRLSHSSETIVLRNELGNPVDRVRYGDGSPINDEDPADGIDDRTFRGSFWPRSPDGGGPTLELVHPDLSNRAAVAWRASADDGGTPGRRNSRFDTQPAPAVRDVEHEPAVPTDTDAVGITCRISSVAPLASALVRWAVDGGGAGGTVDLVDDGSGVDLVSGDGRFSAQIPARGEGEVIRFSIEVQDTAGESLRLPLEPEVRPYNGYPGTFYLYEVDNERGPTSAGPVYRIVMTASDRGELGNRALTSDVLLPATFIADDRTFHLAGVRYRGESSRRENNRSYKVRFRREKPFDGTDNLNLNGGNGGQFGTDSFNDVLASDVYRRADMPYPMEWPVVLHFPGEVDRDFDRRYIRKEAFNDEFLSRYFGGSSDGNFYRARNPSFGRSGNLSFVGEAPDGYRDIYEKQSNEEEDDFTDIIELCRTFAPAQTPAGEFPSAVDELVDVRQWARFFAVMACLTNTDGGIWNSNGEDYFLYHVPPDSPRADAGKWILLPWDLEETFGDTDERLFLSGVDSIERFFSVPRHARLYYEELRRARDGAFSRLQMRQRYRHGDLMYAPADVFNVVDRVDTNVTVRLGFLDSAVSWSIEAGAFGTDDLPGELVVAPGDTWRFFKGTEQPAGGANEWTSLGYEDGDWLEGASGFGYGDNDDATVLPDMQNSYTTLFARRRFQIADPAAVVGLTLLVDYDDAYVAYVNGTEVARSANAPGGEVITFDMTATSDHEASSGRFGANPVEQRDISARRDLLRAGTNVLAIVGFNDEPQSSDLSLIPSLSVSRAESGGGPAGGCGENMYAQGSIVRLQGVCNPVETRSLTVNGTPVDVSMVVRGNGPWGSRWATDVQLESGANPITIRAHSDLDGGGSIVETLQVVVHRVPQGFREVAGTISGPVTWLAEEGPYRLTGNVTVGGNGSLTIEPGTVVVADEDASIIVRGRLTAAGTVEAPIRLLANECGANWGGVALDRTGRQENAPLHEIRYVVIRDGSSPQGFNGCVAAVDARVLVSDCEISRIPDNAVDATNSALEVRNSHIHDIFEGVHCTTSTTRISDSIIENMIGNSDAIDFDGSGDERSVIERCVLRNSSDDGIDLGNVTVDIRDNVVIGIEDKAISIERPGVQGHPTITGNLVYASGSGLAIKNGVVISEGWHNTVANCQEGIQLYAKDEAPDGGHATFHSMIVWNNVVDVFVDPDSSVILDFSDIAGAEPWPGIGNVLADPMFVDALSADYSLRPGSPCIGTGHGGEDMGALPFQGSEGDLFVRGDVNLSGTVDVSDAVATLDYLFRGGVGPDNCKDILDTNDDGTADVSDSVYTLRYLFAGGPTIPPPFPAAGHDPTPDAHGCEP